MPRRSRKFIGRAPALTPAEAAEERAARRAGDDALRLADLRACRGATQGRIAAGLGSTQSNVAQIEAAEDHYLSTLAEYVAVLGGRLELVAVFPDERITLRVPAPAAVEGPGE